LLSLWRPKIPKGFKIQLKCTHFRIGTPGQCLGRKISEEINRVPYLEPCGEVGTKGRSSCPSSGSDNECCNPVSVHKIEEYYFIQELMGVQTVFFPETWIGGYDLGNNWGKGEPSNGYGSCLQINYGGEKDCKKMLPFVCSKRM
uniref:C-type lectin domain-containing protein n=1 Tax=Esox lucius TaxID=8010 RepID=A0A3P8Z4Q8_ESOLU